MRIPYATAPARGLGHRNRGSRLEFYEQVLRPVLFRTLDAERAHDLAHVALRVPGLAAVAGGPAVPDEPCRLGPLPLRSPIGLAAGFDKNGRSVAGLDRLGFGYLVVGSVTPQPREGNPKPRIVRYPAQRALGNSVGLANPGAAAVAERLAATGPVRTPVIVSVAGFQVDELRTAVGLLAPLVDGVELQLYCPNTELSQTFDKEERLAEILTVLPDVTDRPLFVKLPHFQGDEATQLALRLLDVCRDSPTVTGVTVMGSLRRTQPRLSTGFGSITGAPALDRTVDVTSRVAARAGRLAIKAVGGIATGADAARVLAAGATTVEVYTAVVYRGPRVARRILSELREARQR